MTTRVRILALVHRHLIPPDEVPEGTDPTTMPWRTEHDVVTALRGMGHEVAVLPVHDDLGDIRRAKTEFKPHIAFNLLEGFDDVSIFDRHALARIVEHIDAHLQIAPSASEIGARVGLSPSHFAKKFRQSTGLSLHRFVNRRRIQAALESLKDESKTLSQVALDLGFSSQAHFTHLFSGLTGMTPAKYRKQ